MPRYIDLDKQLVRLYRLNLTYEDVIKDFLLSANTVDAVEVIRCRDCVHWRKPDGPCPFGLLRFNTSPPNGFCHLGERRD